MLDIGFSELVVIGVVALVVIGPERLPRVARTAGHLLGRFQRYVAEVKTDINREMELADLKKIRSEVEEAARSVEQTVKSQMQETEAQLKSAEEELNKAGEGLKQMHTEVNESIASLSMPHMGMGGSLAAAPETAAAAEPAPSGPAAEASPAVEVEPSPQLELGLPSTVPPTPAQADQVPVHRG
jgi:sec-independent protein translocase protein TatB